MMIASNGIGGGGGSHQICSCAVKSHVVRSDYDPVTQARSPPFCATSTTNQNRLYHTHRHKSVFSSTTYDDFVVAREHGARVEIRKDSRVPVCRVRVGEGGEGEYQSLFRIRFLRAESVPLSRSNFPP